MSAAAARKEPPPAYNEIERGFMPERNAPSISFPTIDANGDRFAWSRLVGVLDLIRFQLSKNDPQGSANSADVAGALKLRERSQAFPVMPPNIMEDAAQSRSPV